MQNERKKYIFGFLLIVAGAILLMKNLQMLPDIVPSWVFSWQMVMILIGLFMLIVKRRWFSGIILVGIGKYFLLTDLWGISKEQVHQFWPGLVILIGIAVLFKKKRPHWKERMEKKNISSDQIDLSTFMSGDSRQISSYDFKGGRINVLMGGMELNLTNCTLSKSDVVIDLNVTMGGIALIVPKEWNVESEIVPVMGGLEDQGARKNDHYIDPAARIKLRGSVLMGGIEIKRR